MTQHVSIEHSLLCAPEFQNFSRGFRQSNPRSRLLHPLRNSHAFYLSSAATYLPSSCNEIIFFFTKFLPHSLQKENLCRPEPGNECFMKIMYTSLITFQSSSTKLSFSGDFNDQNITYLHRKLNLEKWTVDKYGTQGFINNKWMEISVLSVCK